MTVRALLWKALALLLLFGVAGAELLSRSAFHRHEVAMGRRAWVALDKAAGPVGDARVLVVGDSVAFQLYPLAADGPGVRSLACNQATSLAGMLALVRRAAGANELAGRTVAVVLRPDSLSNDLEAPLAFHYFVIPFFRTLGPEAFSPLVRARVAALPQVWTAALPLVRLSSWAPRPTAPAPAPRPWLSPVSEESLRLLRDLAREHRFTLRLVSPPVPAARRAWDLAPLRRQVAEAGLADLFEGYLERIDHRPDADFGDEVHLRDPRALGPDPLGLGR